MSDKYETPTLQIQHALRGKVCEYFAKGTTKKDAVYAEIWAKCYTRRWCYVSRLMTVSHAFFGLGAAQVRVLTSPPSPH